MTTVKLPPIERSAAKLTSLEKTVTKTEQLLKPKLEERLLGWTSKPSPPLQGLSYACQRWQYNQVLSKAYQCEFGSRFVLKFTNRDDNVLSLRHFVLRIRLPRLFHPKDHRRDDPFWEPNMIFQWFDHINITLGDNPIPLTVILPQSNVMLMAASSDPITKHRFDMLCLHQRQLDKELTDPTLDFQLRHQSWTFDLPIMLPAMDSDPKEARQWYIAGIGEQTLKMEILMRPRRHLLIYDHMKYGPTCFEKIAWMASTSHTTVSAMQKIGFDAARAPYAMPWPTLNDIGQLTAERWTKKFKNMSYWQCTLQNVGLASAILFICQYDDEETCEADRTSFKSIEILSDNERVCMMRFSDALALADTHLGLLNKYTANTPLYNCHVLLFPFDHDPLCQHAPVNQTTFIALQNANVVARFIQPSRLAYNTMVHIKAFAVSLRFLNWSATKNLLK